MLLKLNTKQVVWMSKCWSKLFKQ